MRLCQFVKLDTLNDVQVTETVQHEESFGKTDGGKILDKGGRLSINNEDYFTKKEELEEEEEEKEEEEKEELSFKINDHYYL